MTMTSGEMAVWAGAFVANLDKRHPDLAALRGHEAVEAMRGALDRCNNPGDGKYEPAWTEHVREQLAPAVPMLREMLDLPARVTALPPLPDGFPAPIEVGWAKHKAEHDGDDPDDWTDLFGVEVKVGEENRILGSFAKRDEARAFAWRCAEKPHHVAFYWTYTYDTPQLSVVLEWSDEQLLAALNYIAERDHWRTREPVRPAFFPYCDE